MSIIAVRAGTHRRLADSQPQKQLRKEQNIAELCQAKQQSALLGERKEHFKEKKDKHISNDVPNLI
ncbi:hypothetical protein [Vibrio owensii]|uniref:hypothetical protein n=1 Tax=Vibrio owensii TaxID=696485 RepID=UPI003D9FE719